MVNKGLGADTLYIGNDTETYSYNRSKIGQLKTLKIAFNR